MIVIHHAPGWDEATKEIARRFAYHGYLAISPNLYHRFGPDLAPDDAAAAARAGGWVTTEQFLGDAAGALRYLRELPVSNREGPARSGTARGDGSPSSRRASCPSTPPSTATGRS